MVTHARLTESPGGSETILVVEDEELVRKLVCEVLESKGYRVLEAANGEEGVLVCRQQTMSGYSEDAVVSDGVLDPGFNFIQKPFAPEALAWKVREVLERSESAFAIPGS